MPFFVSSQSLLQWRHFFLWHRHFCVISAVLSVVTVHPLPTQSFVTPSRHTGANLYHSDASYKYKNCACADVLSLFLQSNGRVRIRTAIRVGLVANRWAGGVLVADLQLLPYEAETRTAQRCQAARLHARCKTVTPRRSSSSSELLLQWFMACPYMYVRLLRAQGTGDRRVHAFCLQGQGCEQLTKTIEHTVR